jgi:two-component system KDP operon response regulator KdpE
MAPPPPPTTITPTATTAVKTSEARLLVVEDDPTIQRLLQTQLAARGWAVRVVSTGAAAVAAVADGDLDLVLLDIGLGNRGDMNGLEVCRQVREWSTVPIILVTAADTPQVKVAALEMGADDYLTKPFHTGELVARIRAVLRRSRAAAAGGAPAAPSVVEVGPYTVDLLRREARRAGEEVRLTKIEFDLLKELVTHLDRVLTYGHLLQAVWGSGYEDVRAVHVHVSHLRRKLEPDVTGPRYLLTVPGVGYRFRSADG